MAGYVVDFQEIDETQVALVGGKGAHLGELSRIEGIRVPAGFCVTTDAFRRIMAAAPAIDTCLRIAACPITTSAPRHCSWNACSGSSTRSCSRTG